MKRRLVYAAAFLFVVSWVSIRAESKRSNVADSGRHVSAGSIAAGRAHSVIARPDGSVQAWGLGRRGQLGVGGTGNRLLPTTVPGLVGIVSVSAGAAHTVALSASGEVYAWGAGSFGRLGDGTRKRRERPVRVSGLDAIAAIAAGGAHTLALARDGRVFAWGLNTDGQLGNGKSGTALTPLRVAGLSNVVAIAAGEAHSLAATSDGRVYAWGRNEFSAIGDGTTKTRPTPVLLNLHDIVAVAAGSAHSLALQRSGVVYSWGRGTSGELGTGDTKRVALPKAIPDLSAIAIAAGRHFSGAITTSGIVMTWGANAAGQLGDGTSSRRLRPVPVAGMASATSLALGALHGVAVTSGGDVRTWGEGGMGRLGTGTERDQAVPLEVLSDVPDWGDEPGDDPEPADAVPPTIRGRMSPDATDMWATGPVTVSFECEDAVALATCSAPITVTHDGVTDIVGTATDAAGNRAQTSVTVRLDATAPTATIVGAPETIDAEEVVISGAVTDAASGVAAVTCNGALTQVVAGHFQCLLALRPGRNDVVVHTRDVAGHESSTAARVSRIGVPTGLFLSPDRRTVGLGDVHPLMLRDEFGERVVGAEWRVDDEAVVLLDDADPPGITAIGLGIAQVVAEKDGLRAEAMITVVPAMAAGVERWSLASAPLLSPEPPLFVNRVAVDSPHVLAIDYEDWDRKLVRGVSVDGEVLWQQHVAGIPLLADSFGGFVAGVPDDVGDLRAFVRSGGGTTASWRYQSTGILDRPAQASDGTLYAVESVFNGQMADGHEMKDRFLIALDGVTGRVIARFRLEPDVNQFISAHDGEVIQTVPPVYCRSYRYGYAPEVIGPIAGADGRGYFAVRRHTIVKRDSCIEPQARRPERSIAMSIDLVVLSRSSEPVTIPIYATSCEGTLGSALPCDHPVRMVQLMPDGIGGTLVVWERGTQMVGPSVLVQKALTRIADGTPSDRDVDFNFSLEMIGQDGLAFTYGDGWKAMDVTTGDIQWGGMLPDLTPVAARPGGGAAAIDWSTSELAMLDASGEVESRQPFGLDWRAIHVGADWIGLKADTVTAVSGQLDDATRFSLFDFKTGQLSERRPGVGIWLKTHSISPTSYQHASIRVVPADQTWLIDHRSNFETCTGSQPCVPLERDRFRNYFFTIGAGPGGDDTNLLCTGTLAKGFNRPFDVRKPETQPLVQLPVDSRLEPVLINSMLTRFDAYADHLTYHCFPEDFPGLYNSNSFAHGLLHAASVGHSEEPPTRGSIPGWLTPVPQSAFFKQ